jgi:hypothetical protein
MSFSYVTPKGMAHCLYCLAAYQAPVLVCSGRLGIFNASLRLAGLEAGAVHE